MTGVLRGANIVASTTVALLGAAAVIGAASYGYLDDEGLVDAGFLPALCGAVVFLLALVDLVHQIRRRPELETLAEEVSDSILDSAPATTDRLQTAPELDIFGRDQRARNRQLVLVIAALLAAILIVPLIGLLLSLCRGIAGGERHLRERGWLVGEELPYLHFRGPELAGRTLGLGLGIVGTLGLFAVWLEPYRRARLFSFLNPWQDAQGAGFQTVQAMIGLGSGGIFGVGLGQSVQKANYLPEAHTDMIFAIIGHVIGST